MPYEQGQAEAHVLHYSYFYSHPLIHLRLKTDFSTPKAKDKQKISI